MLARRRAAGLAHLDDLAAERAQVRGEQSRLRRLARAVGTFERDESQAVMLRVIPADGQDDSRTAQELEQRTAKREPHMSAAPAYIVYGHRHAVRLMTPPHRHRPAARRDRHRRSSASSGSAAPDAAVGGLRRRARRRPPPSRRRRARPRPATPAAPVKQRPLEPPPATKPKKHRPAKPIPPNGKIPVMVLNSNGIHGVAHTLAAQGAERRLSDRLRRQRAAARPADDRAVRQGLRARRRASSRSWSATCSS